MNYAISYFFYLYLMLHVCAARFDVTENLKKFVKFFGTKQGLNNLELRSFCAAVFAADEFVQEELSAPGDDKCPKVEAVER